ncbi:DUF423 domain-containing protein [Haloflavibacter putidus]|uniref:DUF423 domain-containing protein n=1 Tax=Haloflavibacter putidus TaxID=2576776 RepID=A0A507ZWL0_9FLAO|nr:DUF423 domain-containing protein [Haloflavibacter putidus]TQD39145.1 DUF423 domain-containing protein [Haloflavibacter putidus]
MQNLVLIAGCFLGMFAIILGAFGAHALKKSFTTDQLNSFETGVKYQMYHALLLLIMGFNLSFINNLHQWAGGLIIIGVCFFSFSIYGLTFFGSKGKNVRFLGPVTPIGGLLLVIGWLLLLISFMNFA